MTCGKHKMTDRELDALVAEKVMGWHSTVIANGLLVWSKRTSLTYDEIEYYGAWYKPQSKWSPSTSISDAWEVVEKLHEKGTRWELHFNDGFDAGLYEAMYFRGDACLGHKLSGDSMARAICLAALAAVGVEVKDDA